VCIEQEGLRQVEDHLFPGQVQGEHFVVEVGREGLVDLDLEVGLAPVQPDVGRWPETDGPEQQPDGALGQLALHLCRKVGSVTLLQSKVRFDFKTASQL
jgi:hypothetical protein